MLKSIAESHDGDYGGRGTRKHACCMEAAVHACGGLGQDSLALDPDGLSDVWSRGKYS